MESGLRFGVKFPVSEYAVHQGLVSIVSITNAWQHKLCICVRSGAYFQILTPASNVPRYCSAAMALFGRFIIMMKAGICGARLFHCIFCFMQQTNCLTQHCCLGFTGCLLCCKSHWRCQVSGIRSWVSQTLCNEKIHTHTHTHIYIYIHIIYVTYTDRERDTFCSNYLDCFAP